ARAGRRITAPVFPPSGNRNSHGRRLRQSNPPAAMSDSSKEQLRGNGTAGRQRLLIVEEALCSTGVWHWYEYIRTIAAVCREVRGRLEQSSGFGGVLAPTNLAHHVLGWHWVARDCGWRKFKRLALIFVNTPGRRAANGRFEFSRNTLFMRTVMRRMGRFQ